MPNERLRKIRESINLNQREFAERIGLKQATYSRYETGTSDIPTWVLQYLSTKMHINLNWLLTGEGEMRESAINNSEDINQTILKEIIIGLERGLNATDTELPPEVKADIVLLYYKDYAKQAKNTDNIIYLSEVIGKDILRAIKARNIG